MLLKIGDVAQRLGITPRAIRHYEDMGLIFPHTVQENNYRLYSQRELVLLDNIVTQPQASGLGGQSMVLLHLTGTEYTRK